MTTNLILVDFKNYRVLGFINLLQHLVANDEEWNCQPTAEQGNEPSGQRVSVVDVDGQVL